MAVTWDTVLAMKQDSISAASEEELDELYAFILTVPLTDTLHYDQQSLLNILNAVQNIVKVTMLSIHQRVRVRSCNYSR